MDSSFVAGKNTCDDWRALKTQLVSVAAGRSDWERAYREFFLERLRLRYLNPIQVLQKHGTLEGEGFSIAAIQCSIVEFLESTWQGTRYRFLRKGERLAAFEYASSRGVFVAFLVTHQPFASEFTASIAQDFYEGVRCGLLHEAQTKNGWRIRARGSGNRIMDASRKVLFRDGFQSALEVFIRDYRGALLDGAERQTAFIRKFDSICEAA